MSDSAPVPIAIIGASARLPGADSLDAFWDLLQRDEDAVTEVGPERWDRDAFFDADQNAPGKTYCTKAGFLSGIDEFDAPFFGIDAADARKMDPQQRLALQEAWRAFEDAGYAPERLRGRKVGVFVGARTGDYHDALLDRPEDLEPQALMGHDTSVLSARISYFLDLNGPNLTVNTACSSMGVALHLATQSLRSGEVDLALVGGVHVMSTAQRFLMHSRSRLLSRAGACRPFDAAADGFVLGEAVGFVVLKPRPAAVADRDWIYGNVLATGVNHSGFVEKGIAAPNPAAQVALIREVLAKAAVPAESIGYVEAHGTGTFKGDAIEANALRDAYGAVGETGPPRAKCVIGSVKANVGHSLTAAVLPGLLKLLLSFRHRKRVRQLHFQTANELLRIEDAPFRIQRETTDWDVAPGQPRRAALGAISYSGTNFHMILEEEVETVTASGPAAPSLITLSAKTAAELCEQVRQLEAWLARHRTEVSLADVAHTLATGRAHWACRAAFVAADTDDCLGQLRRWLTDNGSTVSSAVPADVSAEARAAVPELAANARAGSTAAWLELADLYRRGGELSWDRIGAASARTVPLPGYPFARHRYWLRRNHRADTSDAVVTLFLSRRDDIYQSFLAARAGRPNTGAVFQVKYGDSGFRRLGASIFQVNPRNAEDFRQLAESIGSIAGRRVEIVHLWSYEREAVDFRFHGDIERCLHQVERSLETGARALSTLSRSLAQTGDPASLAVVYLYHGLQPQDGLASGWWEDEAHSATAFRAVRLPDRAAAPADVAALLCRELEQVSAARCIDVAYEHARAEGPLGCGDRALTSNRMLLHRDRTYLVDIGREDGGVEFAEEWQRNGAGRLVVRVTPERQAETRSRLGREAVVVAGKVNGAADLERVREELAQNGIAAIHGVVRFVAASDAAAMSRNVRETLLVDELTQESPLDFFILVQGTAGRRTVARRFADAFVELRQAMALGGQRRGTTLCHQTDSLGGGVDAAQCFHALFTAGSAVPPVVPKSSSAAADGVALESRFKRIVADVLRLPAGAVELSASLETMKFDSMRAVDVVDRLQRVVATNLRPSVFYQHKTLRGVFDEWLKLAAPAVGNATVPRPASVRTDERVPRVSDDRRDGAPEPIAIVGMSGRFPMAKDLGEFWENLRDGRDCVREIPADRTELREADASRPSAENPAPKWGGFIDGIDRFDPQFFGISTREAELMDPQQRLFLECAWHAIEDAGYDPTRLAGTPTGVFVGVATCDYASILESADQQRQAHSPIGWFHSILANRLSYLLDLRGPSQPIDTACSSSLVALHRAVQSIRSGQCTQAIVGGVNALLTSPLFEAFLHAGMLSPDGRCRTFDADANGYVRGEGVGVLFLKPMTQALADGDAIHALIRGSAEGHGGRATSLTAPSSQSQADVLAQAYREARIDPRTVGYIEAHGTGTALGDPVEVDGLKQAFSATSSNRSDAGFCGLGSVKTSIGHLEAAAGIVGVIKVVLAMQHRTLPGNLHFAKRNPYVALDGSPFFVVEKTQPWPAFEDGRGGSLPRRAGVSSFGFGGVNAHVVIEEHIAPAAIAAPEGDRVIVLSGKTEDRLRAVATQLLGFLQAAHAAGTPINLADLAYTLQVGRAGLDERLALRVSSIAALEAALTDFLAGREVADLRRGRAESNDTTLALFADDEALRGALEKWLQEGRWDRLLDLWVKGLRIDWRLAHRPEQRRRIHLPTYPFASERYWVERAARPRETLAAAAEERTDRQAGERRMVLLEKYWESSAPAPAVRVDGPVLILTTSVTRALAERVQARLPAGEIFVLGSSETAPRRSWSVYAAWIDLVGCANEVQTALSWLIPVQRLVEGAAKTQPWALGVTRGLESFENLTVNSAGALHAALYRLLPSEYAAMRSRHLDIDPAADDATAAEQIVAEFGAPNEDVEVCYRGAGRFRAALREAPLPEASRLGSFPADHVLWITGGTRGLGALCARHFVQSHGVKKLVLTGREALPAREEWTAWERKEGATAEKIRVIRALEAQGIEVRVLALDLADPTAVRRCRDIVKREMGPIGGLLHAAGLVDEENPAFIRKSIDGVARVLAPKVAGTACLIDALREEPPAFAVLFSSISAIVPQLGAGLSDYAMANAFLDAIAEANSRTLPVVSVRWPSWRETGMGEARNDTYASTGLLSLTDAEGLRCLDTILAGKFGAVATPVVCEPSRWSPETLLRHWPRKAAAVPAAIGSAGANATSAAATLVWLTELFARELKMSVDRLRPDMAFQEYGMDSILLAQAWKQINRTLGTRLDPSAVFEYPTLRALAGWLDRTQGTAIAPVLSGETVRTPSSPSPERAPASVALPSNSTSGTDRREPAEIVVIGMSCRFPGADDLAAYWRLLSEGRTAIARVPDSRWSNPDEFAAGLMTNVTDFDPDYFLLSPEDARAMDPQALLVLEEALHLFHHAGYTPAEVKGGATGVYLGARAPTASEPQALAESRNPILAVGQNYLAANVSRFFDLHGPSLVVDTACSSALVGMNLAIQALRSGEIDSAVVGGVSLLADDAVHRLFRQRNLLSHDGSFHLFDARASGVVLGEGIGLVFLKTLDRARADGDRIYAVVKGLAVNNDGRSAGPATPNLTAQKAVMQAALERSGIRPAEVDYLEANGSGSEVTDLLELKAIESIYGGPRPTRCSLGSIKPNIGHPLCAEGIASFIKLVLMLDRREQPPFLSGEQPMAHFNLGSSAFSFCRERTAWTGRPGLAALNCFADGGTNVHAILAASEANEAQNMRRAPLAPPVLRRRNVRQLVPNPWTRAIDDAHPFVGHHKAYGQPLLPGLAYLDVLHQHLRRQGEASASWELVNVSIHRPLAVRPAHEVRLEIVDERDGDRVKLRIEGTEFSADGSSGAKTILVTAEAHHGAPPAFAETLDLDAIRSTAAKTALPAAYSHFEAKGLVHSGPMRAQGNVFATDDATVIELFLPPEARADASVHLFHPTLVDGAAVGAGPMFAGLIAGEERLFLPLFYGRFRASVPLGERCFARVRKATLRRKNELLYSDMEFFDEAGVKMAELTDFAYKLVRDAGLLQPGSDRTFAPAAQSTIVTVLDGATAQTADRTQGAAAELLRLVIGARLKRPTKDVDLRRGYYEMGLDSSMLLDVVAALGKRLATALSPTLLFEHATPAELAAYLDHTYAAELARLPDANAAEPSTVGPDLVIRAFRVDRPVPLPESDRHATETLLAELLANRLALWVDQGELKVRAQPNRLTSAWCDKIASNAGRIVQVLGDRKYLPLTRSQKRYWVLSTLQPEKSAYNNPIGMRLRGNVDIARLRQAFRLLLNSHHVLRATFPRRAKVPVMEIAPPVSEAPCRFTRLDAATNEAREQALRELAVQESRAPINPAVGPNVRIHVIEAKPDDVTILLTAHHAVFDGYSYLPVMSELMRLYRSLGQGTAPSTVGLVQYEDYALAEKPEGDPRSRAYWREHLRDAPACVALPLDKERAAINAGHGDTRSIWIDANAYRSANESIQEQRVPLFAFMLAVLKVALAGWSNQTDLVVGTTVQCRDHEADQQVIGDFTNFIPIRTRTDLAQTFADLVQQVYRTSLLCLEHKHFPFDEIVAMASPAPRNINPVYNILVNQLPSITEMETRLSDASLQVAVSNNRLLNGSAMLDLRFEWYEENGGLRFICEYNTDLFRDTTIEGLLGRIENCLRARSYAGATVASLTNRFRANPATPAAGVTVREPRPTPATAPADDLEAFVITKVLAVKPVPGIHGRQDVNFFELGLGSFDVANFSAELEPYYPAFAVGDIFKHPTIRALAAHLRSLTPAGSLTEASAAAAAEGLIDFEFFRT